MHGISQLHILVPHPLITTSIHVSTISKPYGPQCKRLNPTQCVLIPSYYGDDIHLHCDACSYAFAWHAPGEHAAVPVVQAIQPSAAPNKIPRKVGKGTLGRGAGEVHFCVRLCVCRWGKCACVWR